MGFFKRRAKQSAPGPPDSSSETTASEMTTLKGADADGPVGPAGEALSAFAADSPSPLENTADESAAPSDDNNADSAEDADLLSLGDAEADDFSPDLPSQSVSAPRIPINPDSFATTEDYLLAVVQYAAAPPGANKTPAAPEEGDGRALGQLRKTEKADDYFLDNSDREAKPSGRNPNSRRRVPDSGGTDSPEIGSDSDRLLKELAPASSDEELESLRRLVLGREIDGLEDIHRQLSDRGLQAEALSQVVAEAIRLRVRQDDQMIVALKSTVDQIVRSSVRNNPADLADNLFPVMGPAIRRSISESIRGMLQDFSRTLEKSFSLTGLKWRFEAARTGKKFSEVVMLKTIEYQVEQVFFIHTATGISLIHLYHENALHTDDGDQVSAMLTVMQQFVKDSFAEGDLSTIEFGEFNIYIARAPQAYLACVVRGQAPSDLRTDMQIALEQMVMECADELDAYEAGGPTEPFKKVAHYAEALLSTRYKDEGRKLSFAARLLPVLLILTILGSLGFWGYKKYETDQLEKMVYKAINKTGVIPLRVEPSLFGVWKITVLQDELADELYTESSRPIAEKIAEGGLPRDRFMINAQPFVSQDIEIVMERVNRILNDAPPGIKKNLGSQGLGLRRVPLEGAASILRTLAVYEQLIAVPGVKSVEVSVKDPDRDVILRIKDGCLSLEGRTSLIPWVLTIFERLMNVAGVDSVHLNIQDSDNDVSAFTDNRILSFKGRASLGWQTAVSENAIIVSAGRLVDLSGIEDDDDTKELKLLRDRINRVVIHFPLGKDTPVPEDLDKLTQAVDDLVALEKLADSMDMSVSLTIYGHADATGSETRNYDLSQARTKAVAARLYARGSAIPIANYGLGAEFASKADGADRPANDQASRKIELRVDFNKKPVTVHK